jgi:hypothetical protein
MEIDIRVVFLHVLHCSKYHVTSATYYTCTYVRIEGNRRLPLYSVSCASWENNHPVCWRSMPLVAADGAQACTGKQS